MWDELKRLARHSLVYTSGVVLTKAAGFLLIPVYTRHLTTADYGVLELLSLTVDLGAIILAVGLGWSVVRVYTAQESEAARREVFSTALFFFGALGIAGAAVLIGTARPLSRLVFGTEAYAALLGLMLAAGCCELIVGVPLAQLRARERSGTWVAMTAGRAVTGMTLNIVMLVVFGLGLRGIVYANVTASTLFLFILVGSSLPRLTLRFSRARLGEMLAYGWPLVPSGLFMFVLHFGDRFFLRHFGSTAEVGLYALGYRFGMIQAVLIKDPFLLMWSSLMFSVTKRDDAREIVSRLLTYYGFVAIWFALGVSVLIGDILAIMVTPAFLPAQRVVPLLSLAFVILGFAYVFSTGIFVSQTTRGHALATGAAAGTNVACNLLLIPRYGMMGAAVATLVAFSVMALAEYRVARRLYPVQFEWGRVARMFLVAGAIFALGRLVPLDQPGSPLGIGSRLAMVLAFPLALYLTGFYQQRERARMRQVLASVWGRVARSQTRRAAPPACATVRRVLLIAYHFPPSAAVSAHRTVRLARYLPRYGWDPIVLTVHPWHAESRPAARGPAAPDGVPVHRTAMLSLLGLFDSITSRLPRILGHPGRSPTEPERGVGMARALHRRMRLLLSTPDPQMGWLPFALARGIAVARSARPDAIYARGMPWTALLAGCLVKRMTGIPLVVEFADPWTTNPWREAPAGWFERCIERVRQKMERWAVGCADRVVVTTDQLREEFAARYPRLGPERFVSIPVGYDPEGFSRLPTGEPRSPEAFVITHAGSFYGRRSPAPFLRALARVVRNGAFEGRPVEVRLLGTADDAHLRRFVAGLGLGDVVRCLPRCSHADSLRHQVDSDLLLLLQPLTRVQIPAKAYEYLASGPPILALTPQDGATAQLIESTGAGTVVPAEDVDRIAEALLALLRRPTQRDASAARGYQEPAITQRWARVLETVSRNSGPARQAVPR